MIIVDDKKVIGINYMVWDEDKECWNYSIDKFMPSIRNCPQIDGFNPDPQLPPTLRTNHAYIVKDAQEVVSELKKIAEENNERFFKEKDFEDHVIYGVALRPTTAKALWWQIEDYREEFKD